MPSLACSHLCILSHLFRYGSGCGCPGRGEADGVRWYDSTVGRDTLRCTGCGHHGTILIHDPTPAPERALA